MRYTLIFLLPLIFCLSQIHGEPNPNKDRRKGLVVITGVTKGIGLAIAKQFAKNGWTVAGCGRSPNHIAELQKEFGFPHLFAVVDVANQNEVAEWSTNIFEKLGTPDILLNNAGLINNSAPIWEIPPSEFNSLITTNVCGTYNCIHQFVPLMIAQGKGLIINVSSICGREAWSSFAPYCASKFAIEGLTKCLAKELPKGLTAVTLDPGAINTGMLRKAIGNANNYASPEQWAQRAYPYIMKINAKDNGKSLSVPAN